MKKLAIAFLVLSLSFLIIGAMGCGGSSSCPSCDVSWSEAIDHVGDKLKVCGTVVDTNYEPTVNGQPTFLSIGKKYPDPQRFTVVIWGTDRSNFELAPESYYRGKNITVTGLIERYQGRAEIEVSQPSQICVKHTLQATPIATPKATPATTFTGLPPPPRWSGTIDQWNSMTITEQIEWIDQNTPTPTLTGLPVPPAWKGTTDAWNQMTIAKQIQWIDENPPNN